MMMLGQEVGNIRRKVPGEAVGKKNGWYQSPRDDLKTISLIIRLSCD